MSGVAGRSALMGAMAMAGLAVTGSASATVVETLSFSTTYSYGFAPGANTNTGTDPDLIVQDVGSDPDQATDITFVYQTLAASDASFFFLHNIQCKGYCSVGITTYLTNTITNNGPSTVFLNLTSDITAGHLGLVRNDDTDSSGGFQFDITESLNGQDLQLYNAVGSVSSLGASITTSDGMDFANLIPYQDDAQFGLSWDRTPLSVALSPIAAGETRVVTYRSITQLDSYGFCTDTSRCDGVQVAFGDPRNSGGIIGTRSRIAAFALFEPEFATFGAAPVVEPLGFVLDRGFDLAELRLQTVDVTPVPEPGTWAMMILGVGMTGAAARRRSKARVATA